MSGRHRTARGAVLVLVLLVFGPAAAEPAERYDPRLRFRTISTPRFDIHYHQGLEALARRLAGFVEEAAAEVDASVGPPAGRVQVILVDQHDLSNGWATPLPYNTMEISAAAPHAESLIGNTSDWLRLVFVHEYAHIAHLSRAGGWIAGLRRVFGRAPALFPNLFQPLWGIEGLATWQESDVTGEGRVPAGDFRLLIEGAKAAGLFEPLDRVNGGNVDWPSGTTPYLYGAYFHEFLSARYGAGSIRRLTDETARRLPYLGSRAYKAVYGKSLGTLWREFREATAASPAGPRRTVRLTAHGFVVSSPRHGADGAIFYSISNPHGFPAVMELREPGTAPRRIADRVGGDAIAVAAGQLVVDEIELERSVALRSDLYLIDPRDGSRRALTEHARALHPDVSPEGLIVCAVQLPEGRALALLPLASDGRARPPDILIREPFTDYSMPRWSPDGRWIAAERRRLGGPSEIVLVDPAARTVRVVAAVRGGRAASPAWTPDGRHVLFTSAPAGEPFRIHRVDTATGSIARLEETGDGARSPDVSHDGRTLVFVGYTPAGYDLFAMALEGARWTTVAGPAATAAAAPPDTGSPALESRPYSPLRTLVPRFWTPIVESDAGEVVVGAATGSADALGRHAYVLEAGFSTRARPQWRASYAYDRWRPTFFASFSDDLDPWREGERRSRQADAGVLLRTSRVRWTTAAFASMHVAEDELLCETCTPALDRRVRRSGPRFGWTFSNARAYGYSVTPEQGGRVGATFEAPRRAFGSDDDAYAVTVDARRYVRVWPRHGAVAIRGAGAASWGPGARRFSASGSGPQAHGLDFGRDAIGLVRGLGEEAITGTRVLVANVDYRVPLARVDRGIGTVPVFLRSLHGAIFFDAGGVWTDAPRLRDARVSAGAEISADAVLGYLLPVTFTLGGAWRDDGTARGFAAFARIGRAF